MANSILKISEAASIGLHALIFLAKNDGLVSVKEIATRLNISANHLSKVMQRLNKAGYIDSIKGFNGGFKLTVKPEEVTFLEIYELFDGKIKDSSCLIGRENCPNDCIFGDLISSINKQVKDQFQNTKLADFIRDDFVM